MNGPSNLPIRRPVVVRAGDLQALAERLELAAAAGQPPEPADRCPAMPACCHHLGRTIGGVDTMRPAIPETMPATVLRQAGRLERRAAVTLDGDDMQASVLLRLLYAIMQTDKVDDTAGHPIH